MTDTRCAATTLPEVAWHALSTADTLRHLDTAATGLPERERARRLSRYGLNATTEANPEPWWRELAESFAEPLQLLLIVVAVLSAVFGELGDAIAIAAVIVAVAVVETATELRAARAIDALRTLTAPTARVVVSGAVTERPATGLVPGDVIVLEAGDVVAADARVLSARGLRVDESSLTGESAPVGKDDRPVAPEADLAERSGLLHAGTAVLSGEARAAVVATGTSSQLGRLGRLVETTREPPTPLQVALGRLARGVLVAAVAASVLVALVGVAAGQPWRDMLLAGLTVAFATVPEELPILITVLLAVGGRQLARRGALLRRLRAGETLGAVTTVVTDKTGTLTENHLQLAEILGDTHQVLATALDCQPPDTLSREPMEAELADAARSAGVVQRGEQIAAFPFDPTRKLLSRAWQERDEIRLAVSGAPEVVLSRCDLDDPARVAAADQVARLTRKGMRVIAFAARGLAEPPTDRESAETRLTYRGLTAFVDPLRAGVPEAVAALTGAGVATVVVTGDHPDTAAAVATRAGLPAGVVLRGGADVDTRSDEELAGALRHGTVVARATPAAKHRIVHLLQRRGEVVAVTGDGANDAPALAAADVGIAMGRRGSDLARAAAELVLTDDAYPTVAAAVAKGRTITAQLRRAVAFYLGAKLALVAVLLAALAAGTPVPFQPVHIVLLEIFMDLGASVAFVAEPAAPGAMHRPPRPPGSRFLDRTGLATIAAVAATLTAATLPAYLLVVTTSGDPPSARAAAVLAWLAGHALVAWTLRTQPALAWNANPAFPAWAGTAVLAGLLLTLTPLGSLVHLHTLSHRGLATVALLVALATTAAAVLRRVLGSTTGCSRAWHDRGAAARSPPEQTARPIVLPPPRWLPSKRPPPMSRNPNTAGRTAMPATAAGSGRPTAGPVLGVPLEVTVTHPAPGLALVQAVGEIDLFGAPELRRTTEQELTEVTEAVVLDLSRVSFMGSSGLAILVDARDLAAQQRVGLRLVCATRAVRRPLECTGLFEVFEVYPSLDAALPAGPLPGPEH